MYLTGTLPQLGQAPALPLLLLSFKHSSKRSSQHPGVSQGEPHTNQPQLFHVTPIHLTQTKSSVEKKTVPSFKSFLFLITQDDSVVASQMWGQEMKEKLKGGKKKISAKSPSLAMLNSIFC